MIDPVALEAHLAGLSLDADPQAFLVLADWLQAIDQPWGELIALQHGIALGNDPDDRLRQRAEALLDSHRETFVGTLAAKLDWHMGFIRTAMLGTPPTHEELAAALDVLLALPIARILDGIVFSPLPGTFNTHRDWGDSRDEIADPYTDVDALLQRVPDRVTRFGFGTWPAPPAAAYVRMPDFDALSGWLQRARHLELTGANKSNPGRLQLPNLVDLTVRFGDGTTEDLRALAHSTLPALERLSIWLGGRSNCILDDVIAPADEEPRYPPTYDADDLGAMEVHGVDHHVDLMTLRELLAVDRPNLHHFGLPSSCLNYDALQAIARSPLIPQLRTLDLSGGTMNDAMSTALLESRDVLAHLDEIDLRRNDLTVRGKRKLREALPNANLEPQNPEREPDFFMRYVATVE
jgi:hypothetical protein